MKSRPCREHNTWPENAVNVYWLATALDGKEPAPRLQLVSTSAPSPPGGKETP